MYPTLIRAPVGHSLRESLDLFRIFRGGVAEAIRLGRQVEGGPVLLVEAFYDRPLLYGGFGDLLAARTQAVPPLSAEELVRAIAAPVERQGRCK